MLPDMQILIFERALMGYVTPIDNKAYHRVELALASDKLVEMALE